mmetsp:Transcript_52599/g.140157  ORF Transcript_52599/g.140157 Transcript_52599/m.140157 type:complete len:166 (-) Transcript_52599:421-918(-)
MSYGNGVIADRAYNMRGYIRGSGGGPRAFESVDWEPSRPDRVVVVIKRNGTSVRTETRVTRRSVGAPEGAEDLFNASEVYQQIVESPGKQTKVTPIRCVNKFKRISAKEIQVLQRLEIFPRLDGSSVQIENGDPSMPLVIYKYRGILDKREDGYSPDQSGVMKSL